MTFMEFVQGKPERLLEEMACDILPRALDMLEAYASESDDETSEEAYAIIDEARARLGIEESE